MQHFEIAFSGQLLPGAELQQAKDAIVRLFNADEATLARLFSGRRVVIKQRLDAAATAQYRAAFQRAGAVLEVRELNAADSEPLESGSTALPQGKTAVQQAKISAFGALQITARDEYMAAFSDVQALDFGLAPLGADLQPAVAAMPAPDFDLSAMSLAPIGSDMGELPRPTAIELPDISHLALLDKSV